MPDATVLVDELRSRLDSLTDRVKRYERFILLTTVGFQVLVLLVMSGLSLLPRLSGETILVRVAPVDPRDIFRGDYLLLSYNFSQAFSGIEGLPGTYWEHEQAWLGRTVYVTLVQEPDGKHWRAEKFTIYQPREGRFLRGRIASAGRLEFGIESYYLQEGTGHKFEEAIRQGRLSAEIVVSADGQAALRGLRIE